MLAGPKRKTNGGATMGRLTPPAACPKVGREAFAFAECVMKLQSETPGLRVHIKAGDPQWILARITQALVERLDYVTTSRAPDPTAPIQYYLNYNERDERVSPLEFGFFTHVDEDDPFYKKRFFDVAAEIDIAISMSERYSAVLREAGVANVHLVTPGVDLALFVPRVKIGVVGRTYPDGRKGEALVREVLDAPGVEWHFTGSGWPLPSRRLADAAMPAFYREMDYILVPSKYEAGPMCVLEALACGTPVIAPPIGWVNEYPHIPYRTGDAADLRRVLAEVLAEKFVLRKSVEQVTWDNFARDHHRLFHQFFRPKAG